ncbi:MAG: S41 family peptidase [Chloroflexota bacterium]|nr:S41 family peptidase [Chloroflexota bacterium]
MAEKMKLPAILILLALCLGIPTPSIAGGSHDQITEPGNLLPNNTIIIANEMDARFSQDFSLLLRQLRLEWVILDGTVLPESVWDKNLILMGHPDAAYTSEIIRGILTAEEIDMLRAATDLHVVIEKESPWAESRTIYVCSGANMLLTRNAAEEAVRAIIANAPPASDWIQTTFDAELDEGVRDYVDQLLFEWEDEELPLADLTMDVGARSPWRISASQAAEDVERLFYLFSHGYSGYAFFNQHGEFEQARERILQELSSESSWSSNAFSSLLHDHLSFVVDCHMKIGNFQYASHQDFWYDTRLELTLESGGYQFAADGASFTVVSINGDDPAPFILPSLNHQGEPIYRLGLLSSAAPVPLLLTAANETGERQFEIELQRSNFTYYSEDIFREDIIGGIPVVRVRSFSDPYADALNQFVKTASSHRGEPVIIVDIRGNHGGNERWPISWIQGLTGERAESVFIFSELTNKTTMASRANVFAYLYDRTPNTTIYKDDAERHTHIAEAFESGERQPDWVGPIYPLVSLIANDTTVILVVNGSAASAGEGLIMRLSQAENVVLVGENSMGCLTFGNAGVHQLPHSKLMVWLPINFGLYLDKEFREEEGLMPDLWVPAADAVNYAVAAVRQGTITTSQPLPSAVLQQDFVPENPWTRFLNPRYLLVAAIFSAGGSVWAYFVRKKPRIVAGMGVVWLIFGWIWMVMEPQKPIGFGLLLAGVVCLVWGGINLLKARQAPLESDG